MSILQSVWAFLQQALLMLGPIVLGAMGIAVSLIPNIARRKERIYWLVGFVLLSTATAIATNRDQAATSMKLDKIAGSDRVSFMVSPSLDQPGKFDLFATNIANVPVYDVSIWIISDVDSPKDTLEQQQAAVYRMVHPAKYELGTVPTGLKDTTARLDPGYYQINIQTRYSQFHEMLKFGPFEGRFGQSSVLVDGRFNKLDEQTSPPGYPAIH